MVKYKKIRVQQDGEFQSEKILERLTELMEEEQLFQDVTLTIESLAERMSTNRTYVSKAVNENYAMSFRQWLNSYRIEKSIQYMLKNPAANQEEIAKASGFMSASAFNHKFKAVTGTSPRLWLVEKAVGAK